MASPSIDVAELLREAAEIKAYLGLEASIEIPESLENSDQILELVKDLSDKVMAEVLHNEDQIENLRSTHPDIEKVTISGENF